MIFTPQVLDAIGHAFLRPVWVVYRDNREALSPLVTAFATITAAVVAFFVAWRRHEAQTDADRQRRITESFAKAAEQLGNSNLAVCLGGIYTLERISRESAEEYWPVMEMLTAFVRERARETAANPDPSQSADPKQVEHKPPTDVAAALTVIMRRDAGNREREKQEGWRLDLSGANLRGAVLGWAHLERAVLNGARLERAVLNGARLEGAFLVGARLERAPRRGASRTRRPRRGASRRRRPPY